jgi:hypothetical protein
MKIVVLIIVLLIQCVFNPIVSAQDPKKPAPAPSKEVQPANPDVNPVTQAAVKAGILSCAVRVNQVMNFITPGGQSSAHLFLPGSQHDKSLFSVSLEWKGKDNPTAYASATFAPNQANGCGALYETVIYWNERCETLASRQFGSLKSAGVLAGNISVLDGGAALKIFLMRAGQGCISIKKEMVQ